MENKSHPKLHTGPNGEKLVETGEFRLAKKDEFYFRDKVYKAKSDFTDIGSKVLILRPATPSETEAAAATNEVPGPEREDGYSSDHGALPQSADEGLRPSNQPVSGNRELRLESRINREAVATVALDGGTRRACNNPDCGQGYEHQGSCDTYFAKSSPVSLSGVREPAPPGFWEYLEANYQEVAKWPGWMRGDVIPDCSQPPHVCGKCGIEIFNPKGVMPTETGRQQSNASELSATVAGSNAVTEPAPAPPPSPQSAHDFRKKPVVVQAVKLSALAEAPQEFQKAVCTNGYRSCDYDQNGHIHTLEGVMKIDAEDWIIRGVAGEFYPCKPDIFAQTYEPASRLLSGKGEPGPRCPKCGNPGVLFRHFRRESDSPWETQVECNSINGGCGYTKEIQRGCELRNAGLTEFFSSAPSPQPERPTVEMAAEWLLRNDSANPATLNQKTTDLETCRVISRVLGHFRGNEGVMPIAALLTAFTESRPAQPPDPEALAERIAEAQECAKKICFWCNNPMNADPAKRWPNLDKWEHVLRRDGKTVHCDAGPIHERITSVLRGDSAGRKDENAAG